MAECCGLGLDIQESQVQVLLWLLSGVVLGIPQFKSSAMFVNSQLVCGLHLEFLTIILFIWFISLLFSLALKSLIGEVVNKCVYYMASSVSGQDESNSALWLATQAGKMELSCSLGTTRLVPQKIFPKSHITNPSVSVHKHAKKELGQYPAILTEQAWSITHIYFHI